MSASEWTYVAAFLVGSLIRGYYTAPCRANRVQSRLRSPLDTGLVALASSGLLLLPWTFLLTPWLDWADTRLPAWTCVPGAATFALALWLLWRSHADLGRNWSASVSVREGHALVTHGVYRTIRHPMYAAHWLWAIAQVLLLPNWVAGWSFLATFLPFYVVRIRLEERAMAERFGEEYTAYTRRTGGIVPRLR